MKIGHYAHGIWLPGGVASYIRRISREQIRLGHDVVYFDLASAGITSNDAAEQVCFAQDEDELFRLAAQQGLDILHVHSTLAPRQIFPVPVIRTVHGHQPYCPSGGRFLKRQRQPCDRAYSTLGCSWNHIVSRCGSVRPMQMLNGFRDTRNEMQTLNKIPTITVSHFLKQQMVRSGYDPEIVHVLHLPSPEAETNPSPLPEGIPRFVFLGRLTAQKGVAWLLEALKEVAVPVRLDIAGEGHQEVALKNLAKQLGIEERVTFHGWLDSEKVETLLASSYALVFPSLWHEPAGLVSLDAMARCRAVIASRCGGIPEYVLDNVTGLLVEPNDVVGLARAIEQLAMDKVLMKQLGEAGRNAAATRYTMENHMARLIRLYEETQGDAGNPIQGRFAGVTER